MPKLSKRNKSFIFQNNLVMSVGKCHHCPCSQGAANTIQNGFSLFM